jgi:hypothetical protein
MLPSTRTSKTRSSLCGQAVSSLSEKKPGGTYRRALYIYDKDIRHGVSETDAHRSTSAGAAFLGERPLLDFDSFPGESDFVSFGCLSSALEFRLLSLDLFIYSKTLRAWLGP